MQTFLLLSLGFRTVLVEEFEGLRCGVAVEVVGELSDRGGDFEAEVENLLLTLEADVCGPFDHTREVAARLDVLANAEVAGAFFDEGVLGGCVSVLFATTKARRREWSPSNSMLGSITSGSAEAHECNIPLRSSWWHRLSLGGRGPGRPSGQIVWEAVIEKRKESAKQVHQVFPLNSKEQNMDYCVDAWLKPSRSEELASGSSRATGVAA